MIEVVDVAKTYGTKEALRGVSFTVRPGEATGYLGPNGAGKTTTIKMIAGLIRPTRGQARVCGFDVMASPLEVKRRIGYVPESAALYDTLTPNEHLSLMAELHGLDRREAARRIGELLGSFALARRRRSADRIALERDVPESAARCRLPPRSRSAAAGRALERAGCR